MAEEEKPGTSGSRTVSQLTELVKVLALPLVTLVVGYWFNASLDERQQNESNQRFYAEMMGRREEADSNLRKDMFNSILDTFMARDVKVSPDQQIRQEILSLELLAHNFHESLDIGPLFKDVGRRIPVQVAALGQAQREKEIGELRGRLEAVAHDVIEHQLTVLSESGTVERGNTLPELVKDFKAFVMFGANTVPNPDVASGEGVSRVCLSTATPDDTRRYRQFRLEIIDYDAAIREVYVRLFASQPLTEAECRQPTLDLEAKREVDTNFWVGLFDFPMIDNTRLSNSERAAVSLTALNPNVLSLALVYFPGSRASLKDKPYYDEVIRDLVRARRSASAEPRR